MNLTDKQLKKAKQLADLTAKERKALVLYKKNDMGLALARLTWKNLIVEIYFRAATGKKLKVKDKRMLETWLHDPSFVGDQFRAIAEKTKIKY